MLKKHIRAFFLQFALDEQGQGTVEYVLILSVSAVAATTLARKILTTIDAGVLRLGSVLEQDLKTGRLSLSAWGN